MSFPRVPPGSAGRQGKGSGFVLGPDEGACHWLGTPTLTTVLGSVSNGGVDVVDHPVPAGCAPPRRVHRDQDEISYLVDGELQVVCGDDTWHGTAGSLVFLPRGIAHGFTVGADRGARALLVNAPAGFGDLIVDLGVPGAGLHLPGRGVPMPDPDRISAASARRGSGPAPAGAAARAGGS